MFEFFWTAFSFGTKRHKMRCMANINKRENRCYTHNRRVDYECTKYGQEPSFMTPMSRNFIMNYLSTQRIDYFPNNEEIYSVHTSIKRVKTGDAFLDHLYRFMWWDASQRAILYDPSLLQYETFNEYIEVSKDILHWSNEFDVEFSYASLVQLILLPSGQMRFVKIPKLKEKTVFAAFVCSLVVNKTLLRTAKVQVPIVDSSPNFEFPAKKCGLYFVQMFHECSRTSLSVSQQYSVSGVALFRCSNGFQVHYTLTCDGQDNCKDNR